MRDVHFIRNIDHVLIKSSRLKSKTWPTVLSMASLAWCAFTLLWRPVTTQHTVKNINSCTNHLSERSCTEVNIDSVRDESGSNNKHSVEICSAPVCFLCPCPQHGGSRLSQPTRWLQSTPCEEMLSKMIKERLVMECKWARPSEWRGWLVALT